MIKISNSAFVIFPALKEFLSAHTIFINKHKKYRREQPRSTHLEARISIQFGDGRFCTQWGALMLCVRAVARCADLEVMWRVC
jgi:hypothetical protein